MTTQASDCCRRAHCQQLTFPKISGTAEILCPGRTSLSAASMAVWVAASRSAARPVTGASGSDWTTRLVAWVAIQPSMCAPRSLRESQRTRPQPQSHIERLCSRWSALSKEQQQVCCLRRVCTSRKAVSSAHFHEVAICELCRVVDWRREVAHEAAPQARTAQQEWCWRDRSKCKQFRPA